MRGYQCAIVAAGLTVATAFVGCSDDEPQSNTSSSSSSSSSGSSGNPDSGTPQDSGTPDSGALGLYDRLGGKAGLEMFVKTVVETKVLTDNDLKTFFFNQVAEPIPAGHPSAKQITVCFARFVGAALQKDTYPGDPVNDTANTNTPNHTCRNMVASHKSGDTQLNIGGATFDKFVGAIAESLQPLVKPQATKVGEITQAEFDALASALVGTKSDVTTPGAPDGGPFVEP